jgi:predicted component of type VI protein secretion system
MHGWAVVVACWTGPILASDGVAPDNLRACAALRVDADRLACYDLEVPRWLATTAELPTAAATGAAAAGIAAGPTPQQRFGLPAEKVNERYPQPAESAPLRAVTAQVVRSTKLPSGNFLIELDNEQVWWQIDTDVNLHLRSGATVTIEHGAIGSYWLKSDGRGAHVKRIR